MDQDINVDSGDRSLSKARLLLSEAAIGIVDAQPSIDVDDRRASLEFAWYYEVFILSFLRKSIRGEPRR